MIALAMAGCTSEVRYVTIAASLPPPPPRVYGEPLTQQELNEIPASARKKLMDGIKLHRDREEQLEAMVCSTRPKPCP